jgi:hypothetical protein
MDNVQNCDSYSSISMSLSISMSISISGQFCSKDIGWYRFTVKVFPSLKCSSGLQLRPFYLQTLALVSEQMLRVL